MSGGTLFIVSTPIGNLGDFSFRGVEVLRAVALVACEDTRRARRLLTRYAIEKPTVSLHAHSPGATLERLLDRVAAGEQVAYVTDAGTPGISDPGGALAERAHRRGLRVVPVPGPGAVTAALSAAGFPADRFLFVGFVPRRGRARRELLERLAREPWTAVAYEAPGRTAALLEELAERCGAERPAAVARELTKVHEEVRRGTLGELAEYYRARPPKGEITVVLGGEPRGSEAAPPAETQDPGAVVESLRGSDSPAALAKELSRRLGIPRQAAYRMVTRPAR